ncbi:uncharacterized protein PADG_00952 [Paracoccidioides brasiliensis Pb18]|uniref:Uncharacterized protein n=1 Tax=Paracoccidioides brasiliensis (strain Pb18) TaxID=502780 RepID=C1FYS6_PARBD|nr:uncharacterized protein PADG_00952 [Paracoccidioides brasiliensis Pb18]EEH44663.2 hypothetical protein PADG_00952 [Paracoccidioides brasiliensis Pb18]
MYMYMNQFMDQNSNNLRCGIAQRKLSDIFTSAGLEDLSIPETPWKQKGETRRPTISTSSFKGAIQAAADRGSREYANSFGLHVRFANDDTGAADDAIHLQALMRAMGLDRAHEYIIPQSGTQSWVPVMMFGDLLSDARRCPGRSIVVFHFAGHAYLDNCKRLAFRGKDDQGRGNNDGGNNYHNFFHDADSDIDSDDDDENSNSSFPLDPLLNQVYAGTTLNDDDCQVDVVFILDLCHDSNDCGMITDKTKYMLLTPKGSEVTKSDRIGEVLAASICKLAPRGLTGDGATSDNPHSYNDGIRQRNGQSFTSKLADYAERSRKRTGFIELADLFSVMRAQYKSSVTDRKPVHSLIRGPHSVQLTFPNSQRLPWEYPASCSSLSSSVSYAESSPSVYDSSSDSSSSSDDDDEEEGDANVADDNLSRSPYPRWVSGDYRAIFRVDLRPNHVSRANTDMKELVMWIRGQNGGSMKVISTQDFERAPPGGYNRRNIYCDRCGSSRLVIEAPYAVYTQLRVLPGVKLLLENRSRDVLVGSIE